MIVVAKWTIAYGGVVYNGGQSFEMSESDYPKFQNDVEIIKNYKPSPKTKKTKAINNKKTK